VVLGGGVVGWWGGGVVGWWGNAGGITAASFFGSTSNLEFLF
jgi:hypothetical protein